MEITADVIVELYARYQFLCFWKTVGLTLTITFGFLAFICVISAFYSEWSWNYNRAGFLTCLGNVLLFIVGFIMLFLSIYKINVVLKPEIARYIVPAGLDLAGKVSAEVSEMWNLLKGVLEK